MRDITIQPDEITFNNPTFISTIESIINNVKEELGCQPNDTNIEAALQKLIVCRPGSNMDEDETEKSSGAFATLYIQLPSMFSGSQLTIRHHNLSETIQFDDKRCEFEIIYAAHHCDCRADFTPVESGYRTALVYDLIQKSSPKISILNESEKMIKKLSSVLAKVCNSLFFSNG